MPSNKKPRKAYRPRTVKNPGVFYSRKNIDRVKEIITDIMLVVEITLPRGLATDDHMHQIQDLLNWGGLMLVDRRWPGQEPEVKEFQADHYCALHAYSRIVKRKREGKTHGYTGTAEELNVLRDVGWQIAELLREGMEHSPQRTLKEFLAAKQIVEEDHARREALGIPHGVQETDKDRVGRLMKQKHFHKKEKQNDN